MEIEIAKTMNADGNPPYIWVRNDPGESREEFDEDVFDLAFELAFNPRKVNLATSQTVTAQAAPAKPPASDSLAHLLRRSSFPS